MVGASLTNETRAHTRAAKGVDDLKRLLPAQWADEGDLLRLILHTLDASKPALQRLGVQVSEGSRLSGGRSCAGIESPDRCGLTNGTDNRRSDMR